MRGQAEFKKYLVWQIAFAALTTIILAFAIAFTGDPILVVWTVVICFAIVALIFRRVSFVAAALSFAMLIAVVESVAKAPAGAFSIGPILAVFAIFGLVGLVIAALELHGETDVPVLFCVLVVFPIGRLIGVACALWVLANPSAFVIAPVALVVGLRTIAILALIAPVVASEALKFGLRSRYVAPVESV